MAHIEKRRQKNRDGTPGAVRWRARYTAPDGQERSKTFDRKVDAQRFLTSVENDKLRGAYVDPRAGKVTLRTFAEQWLVAQTFNESTREAVTSRLNSHVLPALGDLELRAIRPSAVQAWLRDLQKRQAPSYVRVLLANLSAIMRAAVDDGLITKNPCQASSVKAPAADRSRVVPWPGEQVEAVVAEHPEPYRAVAVVAAGCGLRQGEAFGLRVEDVDFLGRRLLVRRQVKLMGGKTVLAPPKGGREREVPLPDTVAYALSERLRKHPAREVAVPWEHPDGETITAALVFTSRKGNPLDRTHYNPYVWKPALERAGVEPTRANGMHALRHYYASVLLDGGESIRALAEYLGHGDPGFTLRTYTHLMSASEDRTRCLVDEALAPGTAYGRPTAAPEQ